MTDLAHVRTVRLALDRPTGDDLAALHALYSDPRVWEHAPHARHQSPQATESMLAKWLEEWTASGLGQWIVRPLDRQDLIGNAGCALRGGGTWWNLAYRFAPAAHGRGFATEAAAQALACAHEVGPDLPVIASLLEHNEGSRRLAERLGLRLAHRTPDSNTRGTRLLYADRQLDPRTVESVLHP